MTKSVFLDKILSMNADFLFFKTPNEIQKMIASNERKCRKAAKLTQEQLSEKSGVSLGSLKRFETTGEISLHSLLKLAVVLEQEREFMELFEKKQYNSIQEVIDEQNS